MSVKTTERIRVLVGLGMIVLYVVFMQVLPIAIEGLVVTVIFWALVAILIAPPLASVFGEKVMGSLFGESGAKVTKEYSKARSLAAQGRFEEAIEEYRGGLEREPDNLILRLEIAEIYSSEMKDYRRAVTELEECLKLKLGSTQGASILNRMADIYDTNLGDREAAVAALERIRRTWPGTKVAYRAQERLRIMEDEEQHRG